MRTPCVMTIGLLFIATRPAHASWPTDPTLNVAVCTSPLGQLAPRAISDGAGGAIIVWTDYRQGPNVIYAQHLRADGNPAWTPDGVPLCATATYAGNPVLVGDGAGGAIVAWEDARSLNSYQVYAQHIDSTGATTWNANAVPICTATSNHQNIAMIGDDAGGAIMAWNDDRVGLHKDIYAQRVNAAGAVQWTLNGIAICTVNSYKYPPAIVSDGGNGAYIMWSDARLGLSYDAYVQRVDGTGAAHLSVNGLQAIPAYSGQTGAALVPDGIGGAIVVTNGPRGSDNYDVGAQHMNAYGDRYWTTSGVTLAAASGLQYAIRAIPNGSGGAIASWYDTRNATTGDDIYAQLVDSTGTMHWGSSGSAVCVATGDQMDVALAGDGAGGALISWDDLRNGVDHDIYAQRMTAAGAAAWTGDGVAVCTAAADQTVPAVVSDGAGGLIVAWDDQRNANDDIYAQWLDAGGHLGGSTTGVGTAPITTGLSFAAPAPNPARGAAMARYELPRAGRVRLTLLDVSGRVLRVLADQGQMAGPHQLEFALCDDAGRGLASGVYFVRLETEAGSLTRRIAAIH
ncbi:MAG: T9SS type A sorting domain-containing protein [Candidatus Eisenbacteria bacterium]